MKAQSLASVRNRPKLQLEKAPLTFTNTNGSRRSSFGSGPAGGSSSSSASSTFPNKPSKRPLPSTVDYGAMDRYLQPRTDETERGSWFREGTNSAWSPSRNRSDLNEIVNKANYYVFGHEGFRYQQESIILDALQKRDILVLMPTGGGKSLCYQLPAIVTRGVSIVISPLISLIQDQVSALVTNFGIPAAILNSTTSTSVAQQIYRDIYGLRKDREPLLKLLYVTPERIVNSDSLFEMLTFLYEKEHLARFVIDEAHCISSWGHDFRPDYAKLSLLRKEFPRVPIMALTATAPPTVRKDIMTKLAIQQCRVFKQNFNRPNLYFEVREKVRDRDKGMGDILELLHDEASGCFRTTGIVYCMTQKDAEKLSDFLHDAGIEADFYHAGQSANERRTILESWRTGRVKVMCATIAMGMGVDVANVRFVIHASLPKSIEGYYQEAGRAGRDGKPARCLLFYRKEDASKLRNLVTFGGKKGGKANKDKEKIEQMQQYCEEQEQCRRVFLGNHFGEDVEDLQCNMGCDLCQERNLGAKEVPSYSRFARRFATQSRTGEVMR